ncbi:hypothetical protein ACLKA6_011184 [Drosophila palustris]
MSDKCDNYESSLAETIKVISLESLTKPAEYNFAAGDGYHFKAQPAKDIANKSDIKIDTELLKDDHADLEAKPSNRSTLSSPEVEQRWKLRLQKLAEYENLQTERTESSGANGDGIETKPKTWQQFWQDVQQESGQSSEQ